jgi:hypothetical protein
MGRIQLAQLAARHCFDVHKTRYSLPKVQVSRIAALEQLDSHTAYAISIRDITQGKSLVWVVYCQFMPTSLSSHPNPFVYGRILSVADAACPRASYEENEIFGVQNGRNMSIKRILLAGMSKIAA